MKKKSTILNPRFLIPLAVLLLFYIGCGVYVLQVSGGTRNMVCGVS